MTPATSGFKASVLQCAPSGINFWKVLEKCLF